MKNVFESTVKLIECLFVEGLVGGVIVVIKTVMIAVETIRVVIELIIGRTTGAASGIR